MHDIDRKGKQMSPRRRIVIISSTLGLVLIGVVAFALWTGRGTGEGRATATTAVEAVINPADGEPDLFPGFTEGDVYFTITNDNPYDIVFTDMTAGTITSSNAANCPATNITVESPVTGLSLLAPAESTTELLSIDDVVTMLTTAPDGCQGVSFEVALVLTGEQAE
jgi:hypothetical protein